MAHIGASSFSRLPTTFGISVLAAEEVLLVTLRFSQGADREALECCMFQIADAVAAVEGLSQKELQDLLWEQKRLSATERCITLRRPFSDPAYPQKFDAAFRRLTCLDDSHSSH